MTHAVTRDQLGAWLLKCNPGVWKIHEFMAAGGTRIDNWSVQPNYRSDLMEPGDKVILWVTKSKHLERGIWGLGHITGYAEDQIFEAGDDDDPDYWVDMDSRLAATFGVDTDIELRSSPVTPAEIIAAGITDLEVQTQPQMGNPLWLDKEQLARLAPLLGDWPDTEPGNDDGTIAFGDPLQNAYVEEAAMEAVCEWYEQHGWQVRDVSAENLGWDLTCTYPDGTFDYVEVKGLSGTRPLVLLTPNELRAAREEPRWLLVVVTRALTEPTLHDYSAEQVLTASKPYAYKADLTSIGQDPSWPGSGSTAADVRPICREAPCR